MAFNKQISIVLSDAESKISYGVSANYAKARTRAKKIAKLTNRSVLIETREIFYPDLPF